jgi:hypothetical protein
MTSDRARRNRQERMKRAEETHRRFIEQTAAEKKAEMTEIERAADEARRIRDAEARERLRRERERSEYAYGIGIARGRDGLDLFPLPPECPVDLIPVLRGGWNDGQDERHRAFKKLVGLLKWRARLLGDPYDAELIPKPAVRDVVRIGGGSRSMAWLAVLLAFATGGSGGERF